MKNYYWYYLNFMDMNGEYHENVAVAAMSFKDAVLAVRKHKSASALVSQ